MKNIKLIQSKKKSEYTEYQKNILVGSSAACPIKNVPDNMEITVLDYYYYECFDENEQPTTILSILSTDGKLYRTNSHIFAREFLKAAEGVEEDKPFAIVKQQGVSNKGRNFVTCYPKIDLSQFFQNSYSDEKSN